MELLQEIIDTLLIPESLPVQKKDHVLSGNYANYRECHIAPDWLLIYRYEGNELLLYRTGTHADLFNL
jgi:mRNA interferase YafQ